MTTLIRRAAGDRSRRPVWQEPPTRLGQGLKAVALTVLVAPVLAALIIAMANNRALMAEMRNRWWQNLLGVVGLVAVVALSVRLLITLIGG